MAKVRLSGPALDQLDEIYEFIRKGYIGLQKVQDFSNQLFGDLALLEANPNMGKRLNTDKTFRYLIIGKYRALYYQNLKLDIIWVTALYHVNNQNFDHPRNLHKPE